MLRVHGGGMGMVARLLLLAAGLAPAGACTFDDLTSDEAPASEEVFCTLIGCGPAFELETVIDVPVDSLSLAEIRACRNGECRTGAFQSTGDARQVSAALAPSADDGPGAAQILAFATRADRTDTCELSLFWSSWDWAEPIQAGPDEYEVTIEADGMLLYETHKTVTEYTVHMPNGPKCGPTCSFALFTDP